MLEDEGRRPILLPSFEYAQRGDHDVIDLDRLALERPRLVSDLPANGARLVQGARQGRLVRGR